MYAAIRQAKAKPGSANQVARLVNEGAVPVVSSVPGFKAYYVVYGEEDTVTTVSVYEDKAGAEESNRLLLPWIKEHIAPLLVSPPQAMAGEVIVHK